MVAQARHPITLGPYLILLLGALLSAQLAERERVGAERAVVLIRANASDIGAGIIVAVSRQAIHIATAHHLVRGAEKVTVTFARPRGRKVNATVLDLHDAELDLAMIVVTDPPADLDVSSFGGLGAARSTTLDVGAKVYPMGYPGEKEWFVSPAGAHVSSTDSARKVTIESRSVHTGNSGGPLLDSCGRIVGMVTEVLGSDADAARIENVLNSVQRKWQITPTLKLSDSPCEGARPTPPQPDAPPAPAKAPAADAVIYAVAQNNELLWYRHDGREDGTPRWAAPEGKTVGTGWTFRHVFSGGDGIVYAVTSKGELLWYRHDGRGDGTARWAASEGKVVGVGWNVKHVFSGGDGIIYAVAANDDLLWNRHEGREDGSFRWASPVSKIVGNGWAVSHVFSGGDGHIYTVSPKGELLWYRHDGREDGSYRWAASEGKVVGVGWNVRHVFPGGSGVIYAVTANGDLVWNRHEGRHDGTFRWAAPEGRNVGTGWTFPHVFSGAGL